MASWRVEWKRSAQKDLRALEQELLGRVLGAVEGLAANPRPQGSTKLRGSEQTFRIRVGDYRIVYSVNDELQVAVILLVRHRKDVYRGLE